MEKRKLYIITGISILISLIMALGGMIYIESIFPWEGIAVGEYLKMYHIAGSNIKIGWAIFCMGCFLMIPVALLLHKVLNSENTPLLYIGTTFGVVASFSYVMGIMRWIFLAGNLASQYMDPNISNELKQVIETIFYSINIYAGNSFGETIAPLSHGIWLIFIGHAMKKNRLFHPSLSIAQTIGACFIMVRPLEYVGLSFMAKVGDTGVQIWCVLFIVVGVRLLFVNEKASI
ncbi:MAG: DUF4386 family protein [Desulfobacterales bacterium]|nr:DUF4386 family protein [Desulfobacterales bacterium]MCP4158524.1 DUF4386 family protein [Deltaproteobacteria bacterium]